MVKRKGLWTFDPEANAYYFYTKEKYHGMANISKISLELKGKKGLTAVIDIAEDGSLVGVELFSLSDNVPSVPSED